MKGQPVKWCDYNCEHAAFPEEGLEGACRTVAAVWCKALKKLVPKNTPCQLPPTRDDVKRRGTPGRGGSRVR